MFATCVWRPGESVGSLRTGNTGGCELPDAEPFLQPTVAYFYFHTQERCIKSSFYTFNKH